MLCQQIPDNVWNMPTRAQSVFWGVLGGAVALTVVLALGLI